jgi:hypothetical protein
MFNFIADSSLEYMTKLYKVYICPVKAPYLGNVQYRKTCLYLFSFSPMTQRAIHDEVESRYI